VSVVARPEVLDALRDHGAVFVWPRALRCCGGRQYVLEASVRRPPGAFELVHAADGFQILAASGLGLPHELHLDLDRKGRVHAYWNNQGWIG
jgi:hypothetical protein